MDQRGGETEFKNPDEGREMICDTASFASASSLSCTASGLSVGAVMNGGNADPWFSFRIFVFCLTPDPILFNPHGPLGLLVEPKAARLNLAADPGAADPVPQRSWRICSTRNIS